MGITLYADDDWHSLYLPLRMATWIGLTAFFIGMPWLAAIAGRDLIGGISVSGYTSIMASILLFGGLQLLVLGIFGKNHRQVIVRIHLLALRACSMNHSLNSHVKTTITRKEQCLNGNHAIFIRDLL